MGFAILWVVLFHSSIPVATILPVNYIKELGYCGVDIFLFISGIGIYQSLNKNTISVYIKNRLKRIIPVWWTFLLVSIVLDSLIKIFNFSKIEILGRLTFSGYWIDLENTGNWYVYAIILFYLISPILFSLIKESKNKTKMCLALILVSLLISLTFIKNPKLIALSRLPIYIIGLYFSANFKDKFITKKSFIVCLSILVISIPILYFLIFNYQYYSWNYGLYWYPFIIITPPLCIILCRVFASFEKHLKPINSILKTFGRASLEILLTSDILFELAKNNYIFLYSTTITSLIVPIISIPIGMLLHIGIDLAIKECSKLIGKSKNK